MNVELRRPDLPRRGAAALRRRLRRIRIESRFRNWRRENHVQDIATPPLEVIVIGAGLAGLAAGYELRRAGYQVTILEAGAQAGGRASSIRKPFSEGLHADAGGFRFAAEHFHLRSYLLEFDLSYAPFYSTRGDMLVNLDGRVFRRKGGERFNPAWLTRPMTDEERWMFDQENDADMYRICGGVDTLVNAFERRVSDCIILHAEVHKIIQTDSGAVVEYVSDGVTKTRFADSVVCALPFSVLRDVEFSPVLPDEKTGIISELEYRPGLLVYFEIPTEYWQTLGLSGFAVTDTVGELWSPGLDFKRETALTISYTKDDAARELLALPPDERIATVVRRIEEFLPDFHEFVLRSVSLSWDEDRLIRGTRSIAKFLSPAQLDLIRRPEGRIHFAGEHTASKRFGWMEGALESAHRVIAEINTLSP